MTFDDIMLELERLGTDRTKKSYMKRGAKEPVFGVTIKDLKPLVKQISIDQPLAEKLYATGNYDAMYLAAMIADSAQMTEADFDRWMEGAYFYMISDYTVAVLLTEVPYAKALAKKWTGSGNELKASAGWSAFAWLLGVMPDSYFDIEEMRTLLKCMDGIHEKPTHERYAMNYFLCAVGISYEPLAEEALIIADKIGPVAVEKGDSTCMVQAAAHYIRNSWEKGRRGFKRRHARC